MDNQGDLCLTCGLPKEQCACVNSQKTINIVHKFKRETDSNLDKKMEKEIQKISKQRDEYKNILELQAQQSFFDEVQKFESEKNAFLDLCKDESKRSEIESTFDYNPENPESLERAKERLAQAKIWSGFIQDAVTQEGGRVSGGYVKPKGKATINRNVDSAEGNFKDYIDELYSIKRNASRTPEEKQKADRMLDQLFMEVIKGVNVSRRSKGKGLPSMQVNQCPQCGELVQMPRGHVFDECPECGWRLYSKDARRG